MKSQKNNLRKEISDTTKAWLESGKKITVCPPKKARGHYVSKSKPTVMQAVDMSALPSSLKIRFGLK
jgi:hypothetical protein